MLTDNLFPETGGLAQTFLESLGIISRNIYG